MTPPESVIRYAIARVKQGWIKGAFARDKNGNPCSALSEQACEFCLDGALLRARDDAGLDDGRDKSHNIALRVVADACLEHHKFDLVSCDPGIVDDWDAMTICQRFNDHNDTTAEDVIEVLEDGARYTREMGAEHAATKEGEAI